jgi:hypothetical protein
VRPQPSPAPESPLRRSVRQRVARRGAAPATP